MARRARARRPRSGARRATSGANAVADVSARGLLALAPLCVLLIGLQALALAGWDTGAILALSIGVTASMLLTSGPIVAIGRRTSVYLGFEQVDSARRFITRASLATLLACVAVGLATFGVASLLALLSTEERSIFAVALVAYALLWLLASGLSLAGASALVCGVLAGGLALAIGSGVALGTTAGVAHRLRGDDRGAPRRLVRLLPVPAPDDAAPARDRAAPARLGALPLLRHRLRAVSGRPAPPRLDGQPGTGT